MPSNDNNPGQNRQELTYLPLPFPRAPPKPPRLAALRERPPNDLPRYRSEFLGRCLQLSFGGWAFGNLLP